MQQIFRKIAVGLAGVVAAYALKKVTQSLQKQIEQAKERAETQAREAENSPANRESLKTLRLDPKTGVYTTDDT